VKIVTLIFVLLLTFTSSLLGQEKFSNQFQSKFTPIFKDLSGSVMPGLTLVFKKGGAQDTGITDINGEIDLQLFPGDYEITVENVDPGVFRAFLRIGGDHLLPNAPVFFIDTSRAFPEIGRPAILMAVDPKYPPAARAVRAYGEVMMTLKIDNEGKVTSATATSGNPLLRAAAANASRQFIFESSENIERNVELSFAFLPLKKKNTGLSRYHNPYRVIVPNEPEEIQF
jgi:TonB family protein